MEHRATIGPAGIRRRHGIDADAGLEVAVRPDAFDDYHAALMALERARNAGAKDALYARYDLPYALCIGKVRS